MKSKMTGKIADTDYILTEVGSIIIIFGNSFTENK